jgi:hypothetical protein
MTNLGDAGPMLSVPVSTLNPKRIPAHLAPILFFRSAQVPAQRTMRAMNDMKQQLLQIIADRLRVTLKDLQASTNASEEDLRKELRQLELDRMITHRRDEILDQDFYVPSSRAIRANRQYGKSAF